MTPSHPPKPVALVFWVIWASLLMGIFIIHQFAAPKTPDDAASIAQVHSIFTPIAVGLATVAMILRWLVIPRLKDAQQVLTGMIIGLAASEAIAILAFFVVPAVQTSERTQMLSMAVVCLLLSAPVYAGRVCRMASLPGPGA